MAKNWERIANARTQAADGEEKKSGLAVTESTSAGKSPTSYLTALHIPALGELPDRPRATHVDARLSILQARGLFRLVQALDKAGATVEGRRVVSAPEAVRWLLQAIAEA